MYHMNVLEQFHRVNTFVFDVDGVLTDGSVLLLDNGLQARRMNVKDGLALQMAIRNGYRVMVISGASSEPVVTRMKYLGIEDVYIGCKDKLKMVESLKERHGFTWENLLFMGDDLPDLQVMKKAGVAACPADAAVEVRELAHYIAPQKGGRGCVRDVIEKVLKLNDHWNYDTSIASR